jgi:hypothetical protein
MADPMYTEKVRKQISNVTKNFLGRDQFLGFWSRVSAKVDLKLGNARLSYLGIIWTIPVNDMNILALLWVNSHTAGDVVAVGDMCGRRGV